MGLNRGDIIIVAPPGEFGKPRPALVVQSDLSLVGLTVTFLPITSDLEHLPQLRVPISPTQENGLRKPSEIMVDRIQTMTLSRIGGHIGRIDSATMRQVETAMILHLGLA
jgi:mRNA interferase MazF